MSSSVSQVRIGPVGVRRCPHLWGGSGGGSHCSSYCGGGVVELCGGGGASADRQGMTPASLHPPSTLERGAKRSRDPRRDTTSSRSAVRDRRSRDRGATPKWERPDHNASNPGTAVPGAKDAGTMISKCIMNGRYELRRVLLSFPGVAAGARIMLM